MKFISYIFTFIGFIGSSFGAFLYAVSADTDTRVNVISNFLPMFFILASGLLLLLIIHLKKRTTN